MIFRLKIFPNRIAHYTVRFVLVFFTFFSVVLTPEVQAQSQENLKLILDKMGRLENDIRILNLSLVRGASAPASSQLSAPGSVPINPVPSPQFILSASKTGPVSSHAMARLSVQMAELENDLRSVTGAMEKFNFQVGNLTNRMDKLVADVDYRLGLLEGRVPGSNYVPSGPPKINPAPLPPSVQKIIPGEGSSFASQAGFLGTVSKSSVDSLVSKNLGDTSPRSAPSATGQKDGSPPAKRAKETAQTIPSVVAIAPTPGALPEGTVKEQYDYALGLLLQANYDMAEKALQEFVKRNSKDKLAVNARYWLGETFYVRAAYIQAAEVFLEGYQADPKGKKAADSLLKLGMSLSGLGKKREACAAFEKVVKDFSNVSTGIRNTISREKQKNSCP